MRTIRLLDNGEPLRGWTRARKAGSHQTTIKAGPSRDAVALETYYIYLKQGCPQGRDIQHWLEAEARLLSH